MLKKIYTGIKALPDSAKSSVFFILASLITKGLNIISTPFFTRTMSTAEIGVVTTFGTYSSIIGTIIGLGLTSGAFSVAMKEYPDRRDAYTSSVMTLSVIAAAAAFIPFVLFRDGIGSLMDIEPGLVILMAGGFVLNPVLTFWLSRERYEYRYKGPFWISVLSSVLAVAVSMAGVLICKDRPGSDLPFVRILTSSCVIYLFDIGIMIHLARRGRTYVNKTYWKFSLVTGLPLVVHALAKNLFDSSDRIMILKFEGESAVGIYGTLYSFSTLSLIVWYAINASLVPFLFEKIEKQDHVKIKKVTNLILAAYAFVCFILMICAPEIIKLLTTDEYLEAVNMIPPTAAGIFFTSLYSMYSTVALYYKKPKYIMISTLAATAFNIITNAIFIRQFGYIAASYTTLASFIVLSVMQYFAMRKVHGADDIYDEKVFLLLSAVIILFVVVCNFLYPLTVLRYVILAAMIVFGIFKRKLLKEILLEMKNKR